MSNIFIFFAIIFIVEIGVIAFSFFAAFFFRKKKGNQIFDVDKVSEERKVFDDKLKIYYSVMNNIYESVSLVMNSSIFLSGKATDRNDASHLDIISQNSSRIADILAAMSILEGKTTVQNLPISIRDFFDSCMVILKEKCRREFRVFSYSMDLPDEVILADPRILELLIFEFSGTIITLSVRTEKISMYFGKEGDFYEFVVCTKCHASSQDLMSDSNYEFRFISLLLEQFHGNFVIEDLADCSRFVMKFKLEENPCDGASYVVVKKIRASMSSILSGAEVPEPVQTISAARSIAAGIQNAEPVQEVPAVDKDTDLFDEFGLSRREKQIASLVVKGKSDKEIAETLNISVKTVATHNKNIFRKMDVHSRVELMGKLR